MCNSIFLGENSLPDAKEGEKVRITIEGTFRIDEDGDRKLDVDLVDGEEPADPEACGCGEEHEIPEDPLMQDSEDALNLFIIRARKPKQK